MSATNAFETDLLELIFNTTTITNIADNASSSPATNLYVSLHTADPGETGSQNTSEATYTSYARVAVARTGSGWTVSANTASNVAAVTFPVSTGVSNTITHLGIGLSSSGAGTLLFYTPLTSSLIVTTGIQPNFPIGDITIVAD